MACREGCGRLRIWTESLGGMQPGPPLLASRNFSRMQKTRCTGCERSKWGKHEIWFEITVNRDQELSQISRSKEKSNFWFQRTHIILLLATKLRWRHHFPIPKHLPLLGCAKETSCKPISSSKQSILQYLPCAMYRMNLVPSHFQPIKMTAENRPCTPKKGLMPIPMSTAMHEVKIREAVL